MIPPPTQYSFHDSFWTSTSPLETLPKFSHGLSVLHTKLAQSMEENKAILHYLFQRIRAEEQYAKSLDAIMDSNNKMDNVFSRDMGASLKQCYQVVRTESKSSAEAHLSRATNLVTTALDPVERMAAKYTKIINNSKSIMTTLITRFETQAQVTTDAHQDYIIKCKKVLANYPSYQSSHNTTVLLANKTWCRDDLVLLLERLEQTHHPLLGQNILDEMIAHYKEDGSDSTNLAGDALLTCQHLLTQEWILAFAPAANEDDNNKDTRQRITAFTTSPDIAYTIQQVPGLSHDVDSMSFGADSSSSSSLTSFWSRQRWTGSNIKQIGSLEQLCQDMNTADQVYKVSVQKAESLRMEVEENLFMHFEEMECLELERIHTLKQAFISMAAAFSNTIPIYKDIYDRMMLYQETLRPDKDIQAIVEQYRTSRFCPRPILYENYFSRAASSQLFGVPLEDVSQREKTQVPLIITNGLAVIEFELAKLCNEERQKVWTTPLPLDLIHKARNELNNMNGSLITQETLKRYDILLLASVLWLYLLELPECLATFELYDTLKILYANQNQQDMDCHLMSLGKLMTTLPSANYETLKSFLYHIKRLIDMTEKPTSLVQTLILRFTYIIIRPDLISTSNRHDRHPHRFVRDLIEHVDVIFSKEVDQGQTKHHIRQQQRTTALINSRPSSLEFSTKLPSLDSSSMASTISNSDDTVTKDVTNGPPVRKRSFMAFVRRSSTVETGTVVHDSSRRPIPMPSTSTLFEDPEDIDLTPMVKTYNPDGVPTISSPSITKSSSHLSLGEEEDEDDHISIDSFFL
ncbi:hypothetical protein BC941DRAFT_411554 [Chlamydoabsidia padenii]|nr:hypothetical protein BC941DRAFT_411554 [Chlamydoabsidia padenii]